MNAATLKTLSENPPPPVKLRFRNAADCHDAIAEMECDLLARGITFPAWKKTFNITEANARYKSLRELRAVKISTATLPASTIYTPMTTPAAIAPAPSTTSHRTISSGSMPLAKLAKLHSLIFGENETRARVENRAGWYRPDAAKELENTWANARKVSAQYGENSPAAAEANRKSGEIFARLRAEQSGTDEQKCFRLAQSFAQAGVAVPGISFRGMTVNVNASEGRFSDRQRAHAENEIAKFLQCTAADLDPVALAENCPASKAARQFLKEQGRIDQLGNCTL